MVDKQLSSSCNTSNAVTLPGNKEGNVLLQNLHVDDIANRPADNLDKQNVPTVSLSAGHSNDSSQESKVSTDPSTQSDDMEITTDLLRILLKAAPYYPLSVCVCINEEPKKVKKIDSSTTSTSKNKERVPSPVQREPSPLPQTEIKLIAEESLATRPLQTRPSQSANALPLPHFTDRWKDVEPMGSWGEMKMQTDTNTDVDMNINMDMRMRTAMGIQQQQQQPLQSTFVVSSATATSNHMPVHGSFGHITQSQSQSQTQMSSLPFRINPCFFGPAQAQAQAQAQMTLNTQQGGYISASNGAFVNGCNRDNAGDSSDSMPSNALANHIIHSSMPSLTNSNGLWEDFYLGCNFSSPKTPSTPVSLFNGGLFHSNKTCLYFFYYYYY
ncbi:hypothetical protein RFI_27648 [Reticulomyxa filosa]|uniref:Uncharacterized protein n=1 Tax=Reticulomyxa filosa TaxID=46433 RepID=X6M8C9_RETFI|nr:hypothetical protein RFI_27648 [Reticulomyxa filosa]|eukprot:ETO09727.1 hypothetical protein RFI_27648 [Reticulomyxa filosa]